MNRAPRPIRLPCLLVLACALAAGWSALVFAGSWIRMKCEERLVTRRYPEYRDYAARTRRMIPGIF